MTARDDLLPIGIKMLEEPLAQRYIQKFQASRDNRIYTPEDVLGERLARLATLLVLEAKMPGTILMNVPDDPDVRAKALLAFVRTSHLAAPYLWSEQVRTQIPSLAIPRHVLSPRVLPAPRLWFTYETGIGLGGGLTLDAIVIWDYGTGFGITCIGERWNGPEDDLLPDVPRLRPEEPRGRPFIDTQAYEYGRTYPDDYPDNPLSSEMVGEGGQLPSVLAQFAFLASPFIPKRAERVSRGARREYARKGMPPPEEEVTFIVLRRPEPRRRDEYGEERLVEWKHQWIVSGHLRAQWYPSEQAHRLIWIAPYLKGPEDAPMLEHAYKVAR